MDETPAFLSMLHGNPSLEISDLLEALYALARIRVSLSPLPRREALQVPLEVLEYLGFLLEAPYRHLLRVKLKEGRLCSAVHHAGDAYYEFIPKVSIG